MKTPGADKTVAVAMSGGVDSTMSAYYLLRDGFDVYGITALMCGAIDDPMKSEVVRNAARGCEQLGIQHEIVDLRNEFDSQIMDYFEREYLSGRTPSPCALCNSRIKFGVLMEKAFNMGAGFLATGHYARKESGNDGLYHLLRGRDVLKDQSYFLFDLGQNQLARALFPLGEKTKRQVSAEAGKLHFDCRKSRESNELCFVPDQDYVQWLESRLENAGRKSREKGSIVDGKGKKLGQHEGIHRYTVGQRKGLGIAAGKPVYVNRIDAGSNSITVGSRSEALSRSLRAGMLNWIAGRPEKGDFRASVQVRYNHTAAEAVVRLEGGKAIVEFDEPQFAVTPGQVAVFYDSDELIGGGFIEESKGTGEA